MRIKIDIGSPKVKYHTIVALLLGEAGALRGPTWELIHANDLSSVVWC